MNRGQEYTSRKAYVETTLADMMSCKKGFDYIKYAMVYKTEEELIRIGDLRGNAVTLDITAESLENVMMTVCDYVVNGPTGKHVLRHIVTDDEKLIQAAPLFKEVA